MLNNFLQKEFLAIIDLKLKIFQTQITCHSGGHVSLLVRDMSAEKRQHRHRSTTEQDSEWFRGQSLVSGHSGTRHQTSSSTASRHQATNTSTTRQQTYYRTRQSTRRHASQPYRASSSRQAQASMGAAIARGMKQIKSDGNGNFEQCTSSQVSSCVIVTHPLPVRVEMALDHPAADKSEQVKHAWNPDDRSLNIFVKDNDPLSFHRHPVAQSTDSIRGRMSYSSGLHVFEFTWPSRQHGTHAVVGVATKDAPLHSAGYQSLVGSNTHSWGWDLGRCKAYHNSDSVQGIQYPQYNSYQVPDSFLMVLDLDIGTLAFIARGQYLGVAHTGLKGKTVFPIVSSVWGHCEVTMKYVTGVAPGPVSLASWCRRSIRASVGQEGLAKDDIKSLTLPTAIKDFIMYR